MEPHWRNTDLSKQSSNYDGQPTLILIVTKALRRPRYSITRLQTHLYLLAMVSNLD
jgi:hypothetical protein